MNTKTSEQKKLMTLTMEVMIQRFWAKVKKTNGCWLWTGMTDDGGYGKLRVPTPTILECQLTVKTHRLSWIIANGSPRGMKVLHKCDNPPCVRPSHLFLGTQADNIRDMFAKGRATVSRGESNGMAKLTDAEVRSVRRELAKGRTVRDIAAEFGVSRSLISAINCGQRRRTS